MLDFDLCPEHVIDPSNCRLLDTVGADDREAGNGLAHDGKRISHSFPHLILGPLQHSLKEEKHHYVDHHANQHEQRQLPLVKEHHRKSEQDLRRTDQHAGPTPLHELLDGGDVVGDPGDESTAPF